MADPEVFPVDPYVLKLSDGVPRELRYSNLSLKRARKRLNLPSLKALMEQPFTEIMAYLIYEGLVEKIEGSTDHRDEVFDCPCVFCRIDDMIEPSEIQNVQAAVYGAITKSSPDEIKNALRRQSEEATAILTATLQ